MTNRTGPNFRRSITNRTTSTGVCLGTKKPSKTETLRLCFKMDSSICLTDQSASGPPDVLSTGPTGGVLGIDVLQQTEATLPKVEDEESYNMIEPPPLDWRSESSSDAASDDLDQPSSLSPVTPSGQSLKTANPSDTALLCLNTADASGSLDVKFGGNIAEPIQGVGLEELGEAAKKKEKAKAGALKSDGEHQEGLSDVKNSNREEEVEGLDRKSDDDDHNSIHSLLNQLQLMGEEPHPPHPGQIQSSGSSQLDSPAPSLIVDDSTETTGLLFSESDHRDLLGMLQFREIGSGPHPTWMPQRGEVDAVVSVSYSEADAQRFWQSCGNSHQQHRDESLTSLPDDDDTKSVWKARDAEHPKEEETAVEKEEAAEHPSYKNVPGPCDTEDLLDGVVFSAKYLGSTQIRSDRNPSTNARMAQAQEAVDRIKAPEGESQPMTEVDLFISTKRIKVLTADTQETMMDHTLQMISYIADINDIVVLMARRNLKGQDGDAASSSSPSSFSKTQNKCIMLCHVFSSEDAQVIAQAIGQAFGVAYQQFLQENGMKATDLKPGDYSDYLESQELYNGDLAHFSDSQNIREVAITKAPDEILGLAIVESGWGSILPTVVVANLLHGGPAERCGELSIGDRIMSINSTSLVGLPIAACQNIIRDLKSQKYVKMSIVHCPPVTMAIIRRPHPTFQLGFSVEDGIICSLMRGGIAERGGIRVGHRIIEINGQSVVATPHDKIIQILTNAVGEIHLKTMPASTYRLLTGQEQPVFL